MKRTVGLSQKEICQIIGDYAMEHLLPNDINAVSVHIDIQPGIFGSGSITCRVEEIVR